MKLIFLDVDGVLNNDASLAENVHFVNSKCQYIKRIVHATEAKIVFSSTWRIGMSVQEANTLLWACGGPYQTIIGHTPDLIDTTRGAEIMKYMEQYKATPQYIIIDDDDDFTDEQKQYLVQTDMRFGLVEPDVQKAIRLLNT